MRRSPTEEMPEDTAESIERERDQILTRIIQGRPEWLALTASSMDHEIAVALLTGGSDRPYVFGLATSLMSKG